MPAATYVSALVLAADHAGYALKEALKLWLAETFPAIRVVDAGCYSLDSVDYPNVVADAVGAMQDEGIAHGIFLCGSGAGVSMGANRYPHLRAILAHDVTTALWSRKHNDANVLCLGARVVAEPRAMEIVETWLNTPFDGGHHAERVAQLTALGDNAADSSVSACSLV